MRMTYLVPGGQRLAGSLVLEYKHKQNQIYKQNSSFGLLFTGQKQGVPQNMIKTF